MRGKWTLWGRQGAVYIFGLLDPVDVCFTLLRWVLSSSATEVLVRQCTRAVMPFRSDVSAIVDLAQARSAAGVSAALCCPAHRNKRSLVRQMPIGESSLLLCCESRLILVYTKKR